VREGLQSGLCTCALRKVVPRRAKRSKCGVLTSGWPPSGPTQSFWSSMAMKRTLGFAAAKLAWPPRSHRQARSNRTEPPRTLSVGAISKFRKRAAFLRQRESPSHVRMSMRGDRPGVSRVPPEVVGGLSHQHHARSVAAWPAWSASRTGTPPRYLRISATVQCPAPGVASRCQSPPPSSPRGPHSPVRTSIQRTSKAPSVLRKSSSTAPPSGK
jgi:hypothetical protein